MSLLVSVKRVPEHSVRVSRDHASELEERRAGDTLRGWACMHP